TPDKVAALMDATRVLGAIGAPHALIGWRRPERRHPGSRRRRSPPDGPVQSQRRVPSCERRAGANRVRRRLRPHDPARRAPAGRGRRSPDRPQGRPHRDEGARRGGPCSSPKPGAAGSGGRGAAPRRRAGPRRGLVSASERRRFEVVIVGGGIAGASLAYFLAERGVSDVLILEREAQPGYHATGRSAATLAELDPITTLHALKILGGRFLRQQPAGFAETPVLLRSGVMVLFKNEMWDALRAAAPAIEQAGTRLVLLSPAQAIARVPALLAERFAGAALLPDDGHIDVHALLWGYLGHAKR